MGLKHHTIILVPHSRARFRKWRISSRQLRLATVGLALLTLAVAYLTWTHFTTDINLAELERLRAENAELRRVNNEFETSIRSLQTQLTKFEDETNSLAIVAGLGDAIDGFATRNADGAGAGGDINSAPDPRDNLLLLEERSAGLAARLQRVSTNLEKRSLWISAQPAVSPVKGIFTSFYGMRNDPLTKRRAFHPGLDVSAAPGTPVHATADGIVVRAGKIGGLGRAVFISHGEGVTTRYGHLASIDVSPGERVKQKQRIGSVGNSGRSTGYHLHYEVRDRNKAQNPLEFILDR